MRKLVKNSTTLFVCVLLVCSMLVLVGCGSEKEAEYSAFWAKDQSMLPQSEYSIDELGERFPLIKIGESSKTDTENGEVSEEKIPTIISDSLTLQMFPGTERKVVFKIWNRNPQSNLKSSFKLSSDVDWITFPEKKVEVTSIEGTETSTQKNEDKIIIIGESVNIRESSTVNSNKIFKTVKILEAKVLMQSIGEDDDMVWYQIELSDGEIGWVRSDLATIKESEEIVEDTKPELDEKIDTEEADPFDAIVEVMCNIKLPDDVELPITQLVIITPTNGKKTAGV